MQTIAGFIPIRWALEAMNESLLGNRDLTFLFGRWCMALGLSLAFILITQWLQGRVQDAIRLNGELSSI